MLLVSLLLPLLPSAPAFAAEPNFAPPEPNSPRLTLASYNVLYSNQDLDGVVRQITQADANFVCLQEVTARCEKFLRKHLAKRYPHMEFRRRPGRPDGPAILSESPLAKVRYLRPVSGGNAGAICCRIDFAGRPLHVLNVHLLATLLARGDSEVEAMRKYQRAEVIRGREIAKYLKAVEPNVPLAVAGDFNALPRMTVWNWLSARGLADSQDRLLPTAPATWQWSDGERTIGLRLDYVFLSRHLTATAAKVLPAGPSDHRLILTTLAWPQ